MFGEVRNRRSRPEKECPWHPGGSPRPLPNPRRQPQVVETRSFSKPEAVDHLGTLTVSKSNRSLPLDGDDPLEMPIDRDEGLGATVKKIICWRKAFVLRIVELAVKHCNTATRRQ